MQPPSAAANRPANALAFALVVVAVAGGAMTTAACDDKKAADGDAAASAVGPPSHAATDAASASASDAASDAGAPLPLCRVMASDNGPSAKADATRWLDVAAHASFTVRTLETGRELRFEGPGRVRACGDDVALVAEGSAIGLPGSGEAPGAEQWVATACGVARWASGVHRFTGARDTCKLQSSLGAAQLYVASDVAVSEMALDGGAPIPSDAGGGVPDAGSAHNAGSAGGTGGVGTPSPWRRIDGRHAFSLQPPRPGVGAGFGTPAAVKTALVACERAADAVQKIAAALLPDARLDGGARGAATRTGELAEASVVARGVARAACAVAGVRVALAGSAPVDEARLAAATMRWRDGR